MKSLKHIFLISILWVVWSLYISNFGDPRNNILTHDLWNAAKWALPCTLCWYVRICLFPIAFLSGVAHLKKDTTIRKPICILASIGMLLSIYIWGIEMERRTKSSELCGLNSVVPCGNPPILRRWWFTLATAGIISFGLILISCFLLKKHKHH